MDNSPHRSDIIDANGIHLHYLDWGGTGPTILFLTGFGDSAHIFDNLAPKFTDRFRVLGLTRRGHPGSDMPDTGYDVSTLAKDIEQFLDKLSVEQVILVGHSLAGDEMTHFAASHPMRVMKLVYLDSALDSTERLEIWKRNPIKDVKSPLSEEEIHASVDSYMANFRRTNPDFEAVWSDLFEEEIRRQIAVRPDGTAADLMPPAIASALMQGSSDYHKEYAAVQAPALSFYAMSDHPATPDYLTDTERRQFQEFVEQVWKPSKLRSIEQFRSNMIRGRIVELPNTHHYCFLDREDEVVREMRKFLLDG